MPTERDFFRDADPLGFILFQRNCDHPNQLRRLVAALRDAVGRADAPVLIDQEGGRVARLKPPHWPAYPAPAAIAALGGAAAKEAAWLGARLIADDLAALGITIDCVPVLDIPVAGADAVIGDRALGDEPAVVATLGRAVCEGMLAGGVLPVIKHIPGHGRATVDSHHALPRVDAARAMLAASDFAPFRALAAGCDIVLHCNGDMTEMAQIAGAAARLTPAARRRVDRAEARRGAAQPIDRETLAARFGALIARAA